MAVGCKCIVIGIGGVIYLDLLSFVIARRNFMIISEVDKNCICKTFTSGIGIKLLWNSNFVKNIGC